MTTDLVPRYYQIKQAIKKWIVNNEVVMGEKIPSENELAAQFKVSRLTVRQALSQLIQEGFLESRRGDGTYVTKNAGLINSYNLEFSGFMDDLFYQISRSKTKSVEIEKIEAIRSIKEKLKLSSKVKEIIRIKRVRFIDSNSFAHTINYLPLEIGKMITKNTLMKKPLLQIMEQDIGIPFTEAFQTIEASFADQEVAEKLSVSPGSPILFVERIMYTKRRKPVELVQSSYRGDLYKYIVRLKTVRRKKGSVWVHKEE
ncbi:MAG TPA: GntR family transcriptional regulator [Deltaproteobacteria bacterium]|nr:GntR family transcriptional regulator [Deltaproteobacteria bacterium]